MIFWGWYLMIVFVKKVHAYYMDSGISLWFLLGIFFCVALKYICASIYMSVQVWLSLCGYGVGGWLLWHTIWECEATEVKNSRQKVIMSVEEYEQRLKETKKERKDMREWCHSVRLSDCEWQRWTKNINEYWVGKRFNSVECVISINLIMKSSLPIVDVCM